MHRWVIGGAVLASQMWASSAGAAIVTTGPSCDGGPGARNDCNAESCCARRRLPGGTYTYRSTKTATATKVAIEPFALDRYEATVGRFRAWAKAGYPTPKVGTVLQRDITGRPVVWSPHADVSVQRGERLKGWRRYDTYAAALHTSPKNNVNWYTAAAFCHWDGGRLPTDHEWQYAAVGGDQQRLHPWGDAEPSFARAVYNCQGDDHPSCKVIDFLPVGSKPRGEARWGHRDLVGSVFEWTVSYQGTPDDKPSGSSRGGGFCYIGGVDRRAPKGLMATTARFERLDTISHMVGVRCAYSH